MKGSTHFIELYKTGNDHELNEAIIKPVILIKRSIALTGKLYGLKTIAVWFIKPKRSAILASHDNEVGATVIEKVNI